MNSPDPPKSSIWLSIVGNFLLCCFLSHSMSSLASSLLLTSGRMTVVHRLCPVHSVCLSSCKFFWVFLFGFWWKSHRFHSSENIIPEVMENVKQFFLKQKVLTRAFVCSMYILLTYENFNNVICVQLVWCFLICGFR